MHKFSPSKILSSENILSLIHKDHYNNIIASNVISLYDCYQYWYQYCYQYYLVQKSFMMCFNSKMQTSFYVFSFTISFNFKSHWFQVIIFWHNDCKWKHNFLRKLKMGKISLNFEGVYNHQTWWEYTFFRINNWFFDLCLKIV